MSDQQQAARPRRSGYSEEIQRELVRHFRALNSRQPAVQLDLHHLTSQLTRPYAQQFNSQALGRRLGVVARAVKNIFAIYPPTREAFLSQDECTDVGIQLQAFAINVYAIFDNAAWVCVHEAGATLKPTDVGPFKPATQRHLPPDLVTYLAQPELGRWFDEYGKPYRDSTAHRIPPYLPDRAMTPEEGVEWQRLDAEAMRELTSWRPDEAPGSAMLRLARHEELRDRKDALGRNSLVIALSAGDTTAPPPFFLHPQLLSDWGLVHEFVETYIKAIRNQYGWAPLTLPPMADGDDEGDE